MRVVFEGDPAATIICLPIEYPDVNHQPGTGPHPVKLNATQMKRLTKGAELTLVMDEKGRKIPRPDSFE